MEQTAAPDVNWLAILASSLLTFVLGGLWYGPLFGRPWQRLAGLTDAQLNSGGMLRIFGTSWVCALVGSINMAFFIGPKASMQFGLFAGAATGVGFVATALTTTAMFERRPLGLMAIDAGYHAVGFTLMGALLGAWR